MNQEDDMSNEVQQLGRGYYWQDLEVGQQYKTYKRTITETDIVNFISVTGMLEVILTDPTYLCAVQGRSVAGSLTDGIIGCLLRPGMIRGCVLGSLVAHKKMMLAVVAGDTVWVLVSATRVREISKG